MTNPFFRTVNGIEVLSDDVVKLDAPSLMIALLTASLGGNVERTERAIRATYTRRDSDKIISMINVALKLAVAA
jgi:NAD/NADP transhydrogenase alpha subunit